MQGWIKLHRQIREHKFFKTKRKFSKFEAWLDLLLEANHCDKEVLFGNQIIEVKRGSFITSELKLSDRWRWSRTKVRDYLNLLGKDSMIEKISDNKKTTISIVNYDVYQNIETAKEQEKNIKKTSKKHQKNTTKNYKNLKNEKNKDLSTSRPIPPDVEKRDNGKEAMIEYQENNLAYKAAFYLRAKVIENNPRERVPPAEPLDKNMQAWARQMDRLNRLGPVGAAPSEKKGYDWKEIRALIDWCQDDEFWSANIRSPAKLREKIGTIEAKMKRRGKDGTGGKQPEPAGPGKYADLYE